jgi:hypothetical protein
VPPDPLQRAVLRFGLEDPPDPTAIDPQSWADLLGWAKSHNLVGQLWNAAPHISALTAAQLAELEAAFEEGAIPALAIEASALEVHRLLGDAGVEWRVLKGLATARLLYADAAQRSSRDLDILVRPADLQRSLDALAPIIAEPAEPQAGPVRAAMLKERQVTDTRGVSIDIHQAIEGFLVNSRLPTEPLFAAPQTIRIRGVEMKVCSDAAMFVHSVLHSTSGGAQLSTLPDLGRLARRCHPDDAVAAALLAHRSERDLFVWSLECAADVIPIPADWLAFVAANQPSSVSRRLLDSIHGSRARLGLVNVMVGEHRTRRAAETVWPDDEYLQFMHLTRMGNFGWLLRRGGQFLRGE